METVQWIIGIVIAMLGQAFAIMKFFDGKFSSVWKRFDQHKEATDTKIESIQRKIELDYINKEFYLNDHNHMKEMFMNEHKQYRELIDLKLNQIKELIEKK